MKKGELFCFCAAVLFLSGCSYLQKKEVRQPTVTEVVREDLTAQDAKEMLKAGAKNWFYGEGLGDTATKVVGSVLFLPYGIYVVGNAALNLAGYKGFYISDALPEPRRKEVKDLYKTVTSIPGRVTATVAGEEFRSEEKIEEDGGFWAEKRIMARIRERKRLEEESRVAHVRDDLYGDDLS
ncbi:MAG: hypothetical protein D6808_07685 [Candidatus Dadabacteria bacterium]|nr:MAG: hypothetical protein D6808_07685 [Candidatus Dadabacteria bacterium]